MPYANPDDQRENHRRWTATKKGDVKWLKKKRRQKKKQVENWTEEQREHRRKWMAQYMRERRAAQAKANA